MSDQHAAAALTAAAVTAAILMGRAVVLRQSAAYPAHPPRRPAPTRADKVPLPFDGDSAVSAVREAEDHVHGCWQQLQAPADPPE